MAHEERHNDRFEIRLPYTKKQDFIKACEDQSDTPSASIRRFINSYIRRANADNLAFKAMPIAGFFKRKALMGVAAIALIGSAIFAVPKGIDSYTNHKNERTRLNLFATYDANNDGLIALGEITQDDVSLHRVLDVDNELGISKDEFQTSGKMFWTHKLNPDDPEKKDLLIKNLILVRFNLTDPKNIKLMAYAPVQPVMTNAETVDRFVLWDPNIRKASAVMTDVEIRQSGEDGFGLTMQTFTLTKNSES